ncbi:MAG: DUF3267 domain-containing protein [Lachnospiraceae bacterium]|nr:DUF3267 domain-containing protein [Lachnospiraceae bacterium]
MKNYETTLPDGYEEVYRVDAANKGFAVAFNLIATVITLGIFLVGIALIMPDDASLDLGDPIYLIGCLISLVYIVLHELTHGAAYKLLTKQKLTFGLKLSCAYCGVPHIYVYRKASIIATLAPFLVFNIVFLVPVFVAAALPVKVVSLFLFAIHFGGCTGDLYCAIIYFFRLRDPRLLTNDTGPKQTFYLPR